MIVEKQVCTVEQAIKLKELGINQEGIFNWWCTERLGNKSWSLDPPDLPIKDEACAFTSAELSVMLYDLEGLVCFYDYWWYPSHELKPCTTEAEAKAELLIYFLESEDDYINTTVCNERIIA